MTLLIRLRVPWDTDYLFPLSCSLPRSSATILIPTSLGASLAKACLHSRRSTRWNVRCAPTWSGSSMSIPPHCVIFQIAFSKISLDPVLTHPWSSLNQRWCCSCTRVQAVQPLVPGQQCPCWPPAFLCRRMPWSSQAHRSPHTPPRPPIPQEPHTQPRPLPHLWYRYRCLLMLMGQDSSKLFWQTQGSGHPSQPPICLCPFKAYEGGGFNCPYLVGCHYPKAKERTWPICFRNTCCLVIPLWYIYMYITLTSVLLGCWGHNL